MSSKIAVKSSEIRNETNGTRKMALRDTVFLFWKTILICHIVSIANCGLQIAEFFRSLKIRNP